jgi:RNA polymerase sigma factor (TIGR02999 family)
MILPDRVFGSGSVTAVGAIQMPNGSGDRCIDRWRGWRCTVHEQVLLSCVQIFSGAGRKRWPGLSASVMLGSMSDATRILSAIERGDPSAAEQLLPLVYGELRKLAAAKLAQERPGQTLSATALVHEAYLRLVGKGDGPGWDGRGHFFAACAEAMRRILIEQARRKRRLKRGGDQQRLDLDEVEITVEGPPDDVLALDEALTKLAQKHPDKAELVKLRYFAGLTVEEAAQALGISPATADRHWAYARAWLFREIAPAADS